MGADMVEDQEDFDDVDVANNPSAMEEQTMEPQEGEFDSNHAYTVGTYTVNVSDRQITYVGQLIAAPILILALSMPSYIQHYGYGLTVAIIAIIMSGGGLYLIKNPDLHDQQLTALPILGPINVGRAVSLFLFLWWAIAAGVLTFDAPFTITGNGYFATWAGFFSAAMGIGITHHNFKSTDNFIRLAACALVLICAVPETLNGSNYSEGVYALTLASLTLAFCILVLSFREMVAAYMFPITMCLALFWVIEAALVTFRGPFLDTGNGYFASWGAAFFSVALAQTHAV